LRVGELYIVWRIRLSPIRNSSESRIYASLLGQIAGVWFSRFSDTITLFHIIMF